MLDEPTVSRRHARIVAQQGVFSIEDLRSLNGVKVNGRRLEGSTPLAHEDRIELHQVVLQFLDGETTGGRACASDIPPRR